MTLPYYLIENTKTPFSTNEAGFSGFISHFSTLLIFRMDGYLYHLSRIILFNINYLYII